MLLAIAVPRRLFQLTLLLSTLSALSACAPPAQRSSWTTEARNPSQPGAAGVAAVDRHAVEAGAEILARGGNAADAAVATALVLSVTWPPAASLGAGGVLVLRDAEGAAEALDFRERAPGAVQRDFFLDEHGKEDTRVRAHPALPVGVPGLPAGLAALHARHGRLPWAELVAPARRLAEEGFLVDETYRRFLLAARDELARYPSSAAGLLDVNGEVPAVGERVRFPITARSLAILAREGPAGFYEGPFAQALVADLAEVGGVMTTADLASYRAVWRRPLLVTLPDERHQILSMPPPSAGGLSVVQMLSLMQLLEAPDLDTPLGMHLFVESARRAFADRARHLGDPDLVNVPTASLLSRPHLESLAASVDPERASDSADFGPALTPIESEDTTHFSVVDDDGMTIACTITLEANCGSRYVGPRTGILFNNQLNDFNRVPGLTDAAGRVGTPPNLAAPGKRPLTSMSPTILLRDGEALLVTGSPGGRTIPTTVANLAWRVLRGETEPTALMSGARLHHGWFPQSVALGSFGRGWAQPTWRDEPTPAAPDEFSEAALQSFGHSTARRSLDMPLRGTLGAAHSLLRERRSDGSLGGWYAVGDPRREGWGAVVER